MKNSNYLGEKNFEDMRANWEDKTQCPSLREDANFKLVCKATEKLCKLDDCPMVYWILNFKILKNGRGK